MVINLLRGVPGLLPLSVVADVRPATDGARPDGNDDFRRRYGVIRFLYHRRMFSVTGPVISKPSA